MKIVLDNTEMEIVPNSEKTWGDIFSSLEVELRKNDATIIEVRLDGKPIPVSEFDVLFKQAYDEHKKVELKTLAAQDIIFTIRNNCVSYEHLCKKLSMVSADFQSGKDAEVLETIKELASSLDELYSLVPYIHLFPNKFDTFIINNMIFSEFLRELSPFLQDFLDAFENKDFVLLADIAEYEIVPRLLELIKAQKTLEHL